MRALAPSPPSPSSLRRSIRGAADRGQATTLVALLTAALSVVMAVALATVGADVLDRRRAQTAADAAALASVTRGRAAAVALAADHGGTVESWRRGPSPFVVTVVVRVGDAVATARAAVGSDD